MPSSAALAGGGAPAQPSGVVSHYYMGDWRGQEPILKARADQTCRWGFALPKISLAFNVAKAHVDDGLVLLQRLHDAIAPSGTERVLIQHQGDQSFVRFDACSYR
jgi:hypothetical protein